MINAEKINIGGREFTKTRSDCGRYIEREGKHYSEAVDPADISRVYTETDKLIKPEEE